MLWWVVEFYGCEAELDIVTNLNFLNIVFFPYEIVGFCVMCYVSGMG